MKRLTWGFMVALLSILPFIPSRTAHILNLDDRFYVANTSVRNGSMAEKIRWAATSLDDAIWMPLTRLSYVVDFLGTNLDEDSEIPSQVLRRLHIHSMVVHGINAGCLFVLLSLLLSGLQQRGQADFAKQVPISLMAALAALLWSLHPLRCESVCWVASRKDVYSLLFILLSLIAWVKFRIAGSRARERTWYGMSLFLVCLGATAKPSVIVYPGLVFILDLILFTPIGVLRDLLLVKTRIFNGDLRKAIAVPSGQWTPVPLVSPLVLALGFAGFGYWVQKNSGADVDLASVPFYANCLNALTSIGLYIKNTLWPSSLAVECLHRYPSLPRFWWQGLCIALSVAAFFVYYVKRMAKLDLRENRSDFCDWLAIGLLWFLGAVFPFLGFLKFGMHAYADRFTYIPAIGFSIIALGAIHLFRKKVARVVLVVIPILCAFAGATWFQCRFWKDDKSAFTRTLQVDGQENYIAHLILGQYYFEHGHDLKKCLEHFGTVYDQEKPKGLSIAGFIYMMALEESGDRERAQKFLTKMQTWSLETVDQILGPSSQSGSTRMSTYTMSRVSMFTLDPALRPMAEEELSRLLKDKPNDRDFLYLEYRLRLAQGRDREAEELKTRIKTTATGGSGYLRYSFL